MLDDDRAPGTEILAALPIFPLPNAVLLPGMVLPLNVFEPRYLDLVDDVLQASGHIGVPLLKDPRAARSDQAAIEPVFGIGRLLSHQTLPDGRRFIRLEGLRRVREIEELPTETRFRRVRVSLLEEDIPGDADQLDILRAQLQRICATLGVEDRHLVETVLGMPDVRGFIYAVTAIIPTLGLAPDPLDDGRSALLELQQKCLEAPSADERVAHLVDVASIICGVLSDSGRLPRSYMN